MSDLLWQKPGVKVDARIQTFLAGVSVQSRVHGHRRALGLGLFSLPLLPAV